MTSFSAPYGKFEQLMTLFVIVGIGFGMLVLLYSPNRPEYSVYAKIIACFLLLPILWMWLFSTRGYEIEQDHVKIKRLISSVRIPIEKTISIELREDIKVFDITKIAGSGGAFGWIGYHRSKKIGTPIKTYMNRVSPMILIHTERITYLLSPDEERIFLDELRTRAGS